MPRPAAAWVRYASWCVYGFTVLVPFQSPALSRSGNRAGPGNQGHGVSHPSRCTARSNQLRQILVTWDLLVWQAPGLATPAHNPPVHRWACAGPRQPGTRVRKIPILYGTHMTLSVHVRGDRTHMRKSPSSETCQFHYGTLQRAAMWEVGGSWERNGGVAQGSTNPTCVGLASVSSCAWVLCVVHWFKA